MRLRQYATIMLPVTLVLALGRFALAQPCGTEWEFLALELDRAPLLGDMNNDSLPDLVRVGNGITVHLNQGDGTFGAGETQHPESFAIPVDVCDLDLDGDLDVVGERSSIFGGAIVYRNEGNGVFAKPSPAGPWDKLFEHAVVGDMNGDRYPDIVKTFNCNEICVLLNNGDGSFPEFGIGVCTTGFSLGQIALGDLDDDGDLDIAVANMFTGVEVKLNGGDGTCVGTTTYDTGVLGAISVAIGDFDRDGNPDLAVASTGYGGLGDVSILLNQGNATFGPAIGTGVRNVPEIVRATDVDGDNRVDLLVSKGSGAISVLLSHGDGTFDAEQSFQIGPSPSEVISRDVNGDLHQDLIVGTHNGIFVLLNLCPLCRADIDANGDVGFSDLLLVLSDWGPCPFCLSDVDGDAVVNTTDLLLVLANWDSCPSPGGCCMPDGTCTPTPLPLGGAACALSGGVYQGDDTACEAVTCPQPGACCQSDGIGCAEAGCSPFGACCLADHKCVRTVETTCARQGGSFIGDGTACPLIICNRGACCLDDGSCFFVAEFVCDALDGTYQGDGVVCEQVRCP